MARIFISHSSANNAEALALRDWLVARGWDDLFLDIDPQRGLVSGQRWLDRLQESAHRCKAVLFVLSRDWLASRYCTAEFWEARKKERPLFAVVIDDTAVSEVPAEMRGVWQLAFLTQGSRFETFSVKPPPGYAPVEVRFSHEGLESLRLGLAQAGLTSFDTTSFPWPAPGFEHEADGTTPRRPYRGLKPVDVPDAGVFFGRDADLVRALDRLAQLRDSRSLIVILGASGSGKSSFLRAGLLPRLARDDRHFLPLPVLRPRGAVMWGDEGLLAALEAAHRKAGLTITRADLRKDLETGGAGFLRRLADLRSAAAKGLPEDAKPPTLVLPIDQAEELFTIVHGETGSPEAGLFLTRLAEILRHGPEALAVVTIRSDAYEPLQTAEALAGIPQVPFNLPPLAEGNYRSVIEGPADRASDAGRPLVLEPGLTAALLADAQGADALPLLGFTLERLYVEHGGDGDLTLADYEALGGVQGSIEAAVAEAFADPDAAPRIPADTAKREALLKRAFVPHLMGVNEANGEPVRRTAWLADIPEAARGLIDRLIDRRLLVIDRRGEENVIEVAHEALLRRWPTLRRWLDEERAALQIQQEVARAALAWSENACRTNSDWLTHRGTRLREAEAVARREDFAKVFEGVPRAYIDACRQAENDARDAEAWRLARQRAMQRRIGVLLAVVAVVTLVGGGLVATRQRKLDRQESSLIAADAQKAFVFGQYDRAMRLALVASQDTWFARPSLDAGIQLGRAAHFSQLEAQLTGHEGAVTSASFSPDGTRIVTAAADGTTRVWSQGKDGAWTSIALRGHNGPVNSASFSPDGVHIVTASSDSTARVWSRSADGAWTSILLKGHKSSVNSASFSPDGVRVVTASSDRTIRVWSQDKDNAWHSVTLVAEDHMNPVESASFSPDGIRIVSVDGTARVWNRGQDGIWESVIVDDDHVISAAFSPTGTRIVTTSFESSPAVWSLDRDGAWIAAPMDGCGVSLAAFSPDGTRIVAAHGSISCVFSPGQDGIWHGIELQAHQSRITSVSFSPDNTHIVIASRDKTARMWVGAGSQWHNIALLKSHQAAVTSVAFSSDGTRIVTASEDKTACVWSQGDDGAWHSDLEGENYSESFSPDGAWIRNNLDGANSSVSPDGTRVITTPGDPTYYDQAVRVWSRGDDGAWTSITLGGRRFRWVSSISDVRWLMGPGDWAKNEPLSLPETVCREKLHGSWTTVKDPKTGRNVERIAERLLTAGDIRAAPILAGREGEDVCAPFLEPQPWWERLAFWR